MKNSPGLARLKNYLYLFTYVSLYLTVSFITYVWL